MIETSATYRNTQFRLAAALSTHYLQRRISKASLICLVDSMKATLCPNTAPKSSQLVESVALSLRQNEVGGRKGCFKRANILWQTKFEAPDPGDHFAPEAYKVLLLSYCIANPEIDRFDAVDYALLCHLSNCFIYPGVKTFFEQYFQAARWFAQNDSSYFGKYPAKRLQLYPRLMDDFADLTALGFASPRVETTPMELRKTSRPVVTSDGFNGNILPLAMVPGFSDDFQLVFGIPFMTTVGEESIFANEEGIFVRKGLILERQQPVFVEFPAPVRVHYHYPWAPDSALRTHFENQVPMPGNIFGVRLAEGPSLHEIFTHHPNLQSRTPDTLYLNSTNLFQVEDFFIERRKSEIRQELTDAFDRLQTDCLFIKPLGSLMGINAFGYLRKSDIGSPRFVAAVEHVFKLTTNNWPAGDVKRDYYLAAQIQAGLHPVKAALGTEKYSHKIRALATLKPDGSYVFAGALAYLGDGDVIGGLNADPIKLSDLSALLSISPEMIETEVASATEAAANAILDYAQRPYVVSPYSKPFHGTDFHGYQMDWLGFDLVIEQLEGQSQPTVRFIEVNDWRSSGAREIMLDLGGKNVLATLAPIIAHKAQGYFKLLA